MRALVCKQYGSPDELVVEDLPDPVPGPGQLVVNVEAAGINFPDVLLIGGQYQVKNPLPFVPGREAAGVVASIGTGVTSFKPGDRVIALPETGAFAEKCLVDAALTIPLPDTMDYAQAAGFTITYGTSYHALKQSAGLQPGETVLVLGAAGGVGTTAVEIAKAMGARVIAAASGEDKLEFAREVGADETINYTETGLREALKALVGIAGVDVVYDPVGGALAEEALRALAWHGRYLVVGFASGEIPRFAANLALLKEASIVGVWWGTWAQKNPDLQAANMRELAELVDAKILKPRVTGTYTLDEFSRAFRTITERRVLGKVVFRMS